ncbi:MAG: hypothetical protein K0S63_1195 [Gammaproteobacteria bacterium]|nr:hypothetical protein [Gammaproteobacteria bacterium]
MAAMEPLCQLLGVNPAVLTRGEILILEAELFIYICEALKEIIKAKYRNYFCVMKFNQHVENSMIEAEFIRCLINDILVTKEYSLLGIASYTNTPEDVVHEVATGNNKNPSLIFSRKVIELHRTVRPEIYQAIMKKVTTDYPWR